METAARVPRQGDEVIAFDPRRRTFRPMRVLWAEPDGWVQVDGVPGWLRPADAGVLWFWADEGR